jgi:hypothetical protein
LTGSAAYERVRWACFVVGFNNFSTGRGKTATLATELQEELRPAVDGAVIGWYGSTGNFAIETSARTTAASLQRILNGATEYPWAVVKWPDFERAVTWLGDLRWRPVVQAGMRWTPGLAFAVVAPRRPRRSLPATDRGRFRVLDSGTVAIWKHDVLNSGGRLDSARRKGGWGALSTDIRDRLGGDWTSRSARTLAGLQRSTGI